MKNNLKAASFNADSRRLPARLKAGGHTDGRRLIQEENLRLSVLDLRKSALKKSFQEFNLTSFECKVLKACLKIPLGETRTYQWVARKIGHPKAARAVGSALKKNPYPLIIPCHRVVKSDGRIGGYARGSKMKAYLLDLEGKLKASLLK